MQPPKKVVASDDGVRSIFKLGFFLIARGKTKVTFTPCNKTCTYAGLFYSILCNRVASVVYMM